MDIVERLLELDNTGYQPLTGAIGTEAAKEIEMLRDLLVCVTHHDGALKEYEQRWLPIVQEELSRRMIGDM